MRHALFRRRATAVLAAIGIASGAGLAVAAGASAAPPDPTTVTPLADTYANAGAPGRNFGGEWSLASVGGSHPSVTYLRFATPAVPAGYAVTGATLQLRTNTLSFAGTAVEHVVREASDAWSESSVTWNARPAVTGAVLGSVSSASPSHGAVNISVPAAAAAGLAGRQLTLSLSSSATDDLWTWSREHGDPALRPRLTFTYGPTTTTPAAPPPPPATAGVRNLAFGDSIVEGCCAAPAGGTVAEVWAKALGWAPPIVSGSGGTGYLTGGPVAGRVPYPQRIGGVLDAHPGLDVLVIEGGGNDPENDLAAFRRAVAQTFAIARAKQPTAKIYVLGPYSPNGYGYDGKRQVLREEAARSGFPYVDQVEQQWMRGRSDLLWTDGFHPNGAGHAYLARRFAGEIALLDCQGCAP